MPALAQTSSMGPSSSLRTCDLKRQRDENGVRLGRNTTEQPPADTVLVRTLSSGSRTSNSSSHASIASRTSSSKLTSESSRSRHSTSQRRSESKSFYDESPSSTPAHQRHSTSSRSLPESQLQPAKKHGDAVLVRTDSSGSRTSNPSSHAPQRHSASSRSLTECQPTRISSGNRFYADIIAKQQKEHAIRRHKAMESWTIVKRATRSADIPFVTQSSSITRTPHATASKCAPSTTNIITRTSSFQFAASFFQLAL